MAQLLQSETQTTDPRALRSRRMRMDSLGRLLKKKELEDISGQEIADDATLSRATCYLHYPYKNALLQAMRHSRCRDRFWGRPPLVSDPQPYARRGDGSQD